ncbi:caspase activity and apoptosis inhibitor 1 isoform X3 [Eucyclogobius newberryi]|uniref:caspase activity and apoptosis inhibitor 1 isoform X3 n=1 Tax=Eucyclogobius newberryi TaxID=166745 RepID=UPI003B59159A
MLKKKTSSGDKKRRHAPAEDRHESRKRRSAESTAEKESKDELADAELDRIGSDIEEGGLDLAVQFQPITAYASDRDQVLQQCFRVLGEKKLRKMLPDEFKDCNLDEIKRLCWEQLEQISEKNLLQILTGEELTSSNETSEESVESQQDNNVDSTSFLKDGAKNEETKVGGSSEESDVLSINADADDSDIEAPKDEQTIKTTDNLNKDAPSEESAVKPSPVAEQPVAEQPVVEQPVAEQPVVEQPVAEQPVPEQPVPAQSTAPKKDIQSDIDRSVSEILSFSAAEPVTPSVSAPQATLPVQSAPPLSSGGVCQPSIQQLELLELEMRARAIKALMKAGKKTTN